MKRTLAVLILGLAAISAFAQSKFSWIDSVTDDPEKLLPGVNPMKVQGDIVTSGSSTVFPLSVVVTENFKKEGYTGNISIDSIGSGGGFKRFIKGEIDISNASVKISESQIADATKAGYPPIEIRVGTDALAVCVSKKNKFLTDVTKDELVKIFSTAIFWSDVRASWPKKEISRFIPGTDSGTFSYFAEDLYSKKKEPLLEAKNLSMSEDDNVLVQGIEGSEYAIGFFGYAYYAENKAKLNVLSVNKVTPNQQSVDAGTYPLARPLFMYTTQKILNEKPQVAAYMAYYLANVNKYIKKVGYFPAPAADLKKAKQAFLAAVKGRY